MNITGDHSDLPPRTESRAERMARILSGAPCGKVVPASIFTFTPATAIKAATIAHRGNVANRAK